MSLVIQHTEKLKVLALWKRYIHNFSRFFSQSVTRCMRGVVASRQTIWFYFKFFLKIIWQTTVILAKFLCFVLKWVCFGWVLMTVLTTARKKCDPITKIILVCFGVGALRRLFRHK